MNSQDRKQSSWTPLAMSIALVVGILIGVFMGNPFKSRSWIEGDRKLNSILNLISEEYVDDTVNVNNLIEMALPEILAKLDPHCVYLNADELTAANEDLNGSFSGIGIEFQSINDTIRVVDVIPGGPSDKVGLMAGDRIVTVNDSSFIGADVMKVRSKLRGPKGSTVKVGIKRSTGNKVYNFTITRGAIPVNSVVASYIIEKGTGYVKVNQFGANTYREFLTALTALKADGAKRYIIDLRGNGGGYMERAVMMANEFLPANQLIVKTVGRYKRDEDAVYSDGNGSFQDAEVVVLIDEFSASASEIFAGALQDNDRGLIVGCRSFGKGLVQRQFELPDKSAVRLTIARYYTPSGRCIQKPYDTYADDLYDRVSHGELYSRDSIKVDRSQIFSTSTGRKVYGGGGIVPDIFVPRDTTGYTSYYRAVVAAGLMQQFSFSYVDNNRSALNAVKDYKQLLRNMPANERLLNDFVEFASKRDVPARWYYINLSRDNILTGLKALIARDLFGQSAYYPIVNRNDKTIEAALRALNHHKAAFPITDD